jgi:hypothetical protein
MLPLFTVFGYDHSGNKTKCLAKGHELILFFSLINFYSHHLYGHFSLN